MYLDASSAPNYFEACLECSYPSASGGMLTAYHAPMVGQIEDGTDLEVAQRILQRAADCTAWLRRYFNGYEIVAGYCGTTAAGGPGKWPEHDW